MEYSNPALIRYQEDVYTLLSLINEMKPEDIPSISFEELEKALSTTNLWPYTVYHQAMTGQYTTDMARLEQALGYPVRRRLPSGEKQEG